MKENLGVPLIYIDWLMGNRMKKIKYIPIELPDDKVKQKLKVAAYCRVSTKGKQQQGSLELQIEYYTDLINNNSGWKFAGVFFDYGKSGLNRSDRKGLELMMKKAWKGEIDLIITKSISRFSRNTLDSLIFIRKLKERKIYMYFEKENINTKDNNSELMVEIMCGFAQKESRNLSENIQWG
jgi:site-specific DNA recombinase